MPEALPYMIYLVLVQHITMFFLHLSTFLLLSNTFFTKMRLFKLGEISPPFFIYLLTILIMAMLGLINSGYMVTMWWGGRNNGYVIYISTAAVLMILPISSLSIFFLILHRTLIIKRFLARTNIHSWLFIVSIILMVLLFAATVTYFVWAASFIAVPAPTNCWSVTCVVWNGSVFSVWAKLVTGFMNAVIGTWFFYELKKSQKHMHGFLRAGQISNRKRANKLALLTIISEIALSSIPAFIDLFLRSTINLSLTQYVNSYSFVFGAADGTFMAVMYSKSFRKTKTMNVSLITSTLSAGKLRTFKMSKIG